MKENVVCVTVRDSGCGMDKETAESKSPDFIYKNREVDKQLYMPQVGIGIVLILAFIGIMNYMNTNVIYFKPDNYCG